MENAHPHIAIFETSRKGGRFHAVSPSGISKMSSIHPDMEGSTVQVNPEIRKQRITGFGGSFTDASAFWFTK